MSALRRDQQIQIRAPEQAKVLIDRAATMAGMTRSQFMLDTAIKAAESTILDQTVFMVDEAQQAAFEAALDAPVDTDRLGRLLSSPAPWDM